MDIGDFGRMAGPSSAGYSNRWRRDGQAPKALVVACIDSRVDPAMIFDAAPGEMLTVRNVANLVPPYAPDAAYHGTSAALEFGVRVMEVPHLIVMGHGLCGGVRALLEGAPGRGARIRGAVDVDCGRGAGQSDGLVRRRRNGSSAANSRRSKSRWAT